MRIRNDALSLIAWRGLTSNASAADRSLSRLSSGQRINSAADDVSGFGIAQRMRGQYRGKIQANRNAADAVNLLNTADGALDQMQAILQRSYQLAMQAANGTFSDADRTALQVEFDHAMAEIDRIADTTAFNEKPLLNPFGNSASVRTVLKGLRSGWLEQAEKVISTFYGLVGDGSPLTVVLEAAGVNPAWISGIPAAGGRLEDMKLHININEFAGPTGPDGGTGPIFNDRKVARALTEAVLARNTNYVSLDKWFVSGAGDYVAGGDENLKKAVDIFGANAVASSLGGPWTGREPQLSSAYAAMKYAVSILPPGMNVDRIMQELVQAGDLNSAFLNTVGFDVASFVVDFQTNGAAFIGTLNLSDADVGGLNPGDASKVIPNGGKYSESPVNGFSMNWPTKLTDEASRRLTVQIGANQPDVIEVTLPEVSTTTLNLIGSDVLARARETLAEVEGAINSISTSRTSLGSVSNRLEHAISVNNNAAEQELSGLSRIVDVDFAQEMVNLTKNQITASSSTAMSAHSNALRENVMQLLSGIPASSTDTDTES